MSVAGIASFNLFDMNSISTHDRVQQFHKEFQQLGQDLQSGNLSAAQSDFTALQQLEPNSTAQSSPQNSIAQDFQQLSTDLQSGNLNAAQQDYTKIQQDFQFAAQAHGHHQHHHHADNDQNSSQSSNPISQLFNQLGQALQSGDLSTAQQAYTSLQQDLQQFALNRGALSSPNSTGFSVNA